MHGLVQLLPKTPFFVPLSVPVSVSLSISVNKSQL